MPRVRNRLVGQIALVATALAVGFALTVFLSNRKAPPAPAETRAPGTEKMARLLREKFDAENPTLNYLANKKRVAMLKTRLERAKDRGEMLNIRVRLAFENLYAGHVDDALNDFRYLLKNVKSEDVPLIRDPRLNNPTAPLTVQLWHFFAVAQLRAGEVKNCIDRHNHHSCIFPIQGHGVHGDRTGAEKAAKVWSKILEKAPDNDHLKWLLNIAHMALGEYPDKVPKTLLFPPKLFASERDFPRFEDIGPQVGLNVTTGAGSSVLDDFRNTGELDLFLSTPRLDEQLYYFRNNGKSGSEFSFYNATREAGLTGITEGKNLAQGDYDNDGCLDLFVTRGSYRQLGEGDIPNSLLRGHCDGTFEDVTEQAGVLRAQPTYTAAWWDYDNDGWLDLIVPNESAPPLDIMGSDPARVTIVPRGIELWHNNRNGTFTEMAKSAGLDFSGNYKGVLWSDFDGDGRGDLFLADIDGESRLLHNDGPDSHGVWHFSDVTKKAGLPTDIRARTLIFFDYDNDGDEDLFAAWGQGSDPITFYDVASSYRGEPVKRHPRLFRNNGKGTFTDVTAAMGLARAMPIMGANFGDLDYDGFLDLYFGTGATDLDQLFPNRMFWNKAGTRFLDVTTASGTGHLQKGHGVSFADLDRDGTLDFISQQGGGFEGDKYWTSLFRNPGFGNNWIQIKVKGAKSNRAGIGARIKVTVVDHGKTRHIYRTVNSGGSRGCNPLVQYIGIGRAPKIKRLEVHWPASGLTTALDDVAVNQWLTIEEK